MLAKYSSITVVSMLAGFQGILRV